jgi:hyperosmotically inducible protein
MTHSRAFALVAAFCFAIALPGAHAGRTAGEHVDDTTVATSTKSALARAEPSAAGSINVEVYKGAVQLAGFVPSDAHRAAAIAAARGVGGVTEVLDGMVVLDTSRSAGQMLDDTTIQTKLKSALTGSEGLGEAIAINTEVRKGHVILSGFVRDPAVRDQAGRIAAGIAGVAEVHNAVEVRP